LDQLPCFARLTVALPEDVRIPVWVASEHARIVELHHLVHHLAEVVGSAEHEGGRLPGGRLPGGVRGLDTGPGADVSP
jgi:hypothetical protein